MTKASTLHSTPFFKPDGWTYSFQPGLWRSSRGDVRVFSQSAAHAHRNVLLTDDYYNETEVKKVPLLRDPTIA
jgi:hypothetical protein